MWDDGDVRAVWRASYVARALHSYAVSLVASPSAPSTTSIAPHRWEALSAGLRMEAPLAPWLVARRLGHRLPLLHHCTTTYLHEIRRQGRTVNVAHTRTEHGEGSGKRTENVTSCDRSLICRENNGAPNGPHASAACPSCRRRRSA